LHIPSKDPSSFPFLRLVPRKKTPGSKAEQSSNKETSPALNQPDVATCYYPSSRPQPSTRKPLTEP
ncbi:MAG: hypothetical protein ACRD3K_03520, partial [Edaphobacter sp.]